MTLDASEFLRRFLLHVLPSGFVRIRHFGFLSNRLRHEKLAACRVLLDSDSAPECSTASLSVEPVVNDVEPVSTIVCPQCGKARMLVVDYLPSTPIGSESLEQLGGSPVFDTS